MLTLNIEDDSLKIALIKGKKVLSAVEAPVAAGAVQNGVVIDKQGVSQLISGLLAENAISEKDVLACVSGIHSIYRVVSVPRLDPKLLTEVARKEMERVSPVPLDTLYIAWQEIRLSGAESALCLMGLPHDNVDSVMETVKLSGLRIKSVELKPLVVARVIDERTAAVVNVQAGGFDITVVHNTVPELIRSLSFPSESMTEQEKMAVIKEELARTVNFYNSSHAGKQLDENTSCFLSGLVSSGLAPELGYPVKPLPEPVAYAAGIDKARFAANTGLALGETGDSNRWMRVTINVLPRIVKAKEAPKANAAPAVVLIIGVCIIVAMIFINGTAAKETARLQLLVNEKTKQVTDIQKLLRDDRDKIVKQRDDLKTSLTQLKGPIDFMNSSRGYINGDIGRVIAALPGVMFLTTIDDNGDSIVLEGLAPDTDTVIGYARSLRQTGLFKQVTITTLQNLSYNDMKFNILLSAAR
jgi:Tfp pilus assembly protein PilN